MKENKTRIILIILLFGAFCFGGGVFFGQYMLTEKGFVYEEQSAERVTAARNINTASAAELAEVKGIGAVTAEKIVTSREEEGAFASVEELKERGILGETKFLEVAPFLTVD